MRKVKIGDYVKRKWKHKNGTWKEDWTRECYHKVIGTYSGYIRLDIDDKNGNMTEYPHHIDFFIRPTKVLDNPITRELYKDQIITEDEQWLIIKA